MNTAKIILAAVFATTLSGAVAANAPEEAQSVNVSAVTYSDLNLASEQGRNALDRRLRKAARAVCGFRATRLDGKVAAATNRQCYYDALKQARLEVHNLFAVAIQE